MPTRTMNAELTIDDSVPERPEGIAGIAIDGEFITLSRADFSLAEMREIRNFVRLNSGLPIANIAESLNTGEIDWRTDVLPAMIYVVKLRSDESYTYDDADLLANDDEQLAEMERDAVEKYFRRHPDKRPKTPAADDDDPSDGDAAGESSEGEQRHPPASRRTTKPKPKSS